MEQITLGGGCFWCLEAVYQELEGVTNVVSGYAGGHVENPTYQDVCLEITGHAEVVQLTFDPAIVSIEKILDVFFTIHDPTTRNRQGADCGTQYRSAIFWHNEKQQRIVADFVQRIASEGIWKDPIVTEVAPLTSFYAAEGYHQRYYRNNPFQPYCMMVVRPKVMKFREKFLK